LRDALAVQEAGAFALVLELVPAALAKFITEQLRIPTIGIGAGAGCDGQVQVFHDILALFDEFIPKHTKRYADIGGLMQAAISHYRAEVRERQFPAEENSFAIKDEVIETLREEVTHANR
ncbi:MAG: 3-methyl-2-oxobutanoate hydroxymethyltransferase, partial [Anaerolineae bacterium]|nr:3-methyl-2-oxobutanoate hydroxymethyltransferase [Anaerolineae bacterium]